MKTLLCTVKGSSPEADLVEIQESTHKKVYDQTGNLAFVDYDWKSDQIPDAPNLILSYHNFEETPADLPSLLALLRSRHKAKYYKIATHANSTLDALRLLQLMQSHPDLIGVAMGPLGQATRILAPVMGSPLTYAPLSLEGATAPGQIPLHELLTFYHFRKLSRQTPIFALIGDPIEQSPGHLYHNDKMQGEQGIYVKLKIKAEELSTFFELIRKLPFRGLSITIPHKESVIAYLDEHDAKSQKMGAVNTALIQDGKILGTNTDGAGALEALGNVQGKKIAIIGAGGSARAIAFEALSRGAHVVIANRTHARAENLAHLFQCGASTLEAISPHDILVQATGEDLTLALTPGSTVLDISLKGNFLQKQALEKGCRFISGYEMYLRQAELQRDFWFTLHS